MGNIGDTDIFVCLVFFEKMRNIDWIIIIICVITSLYCFYTISHLNDIEEEVLKECNEHWVKEFKEKCIKQDFTAPEFNFTMDYSTKK